MKRPSRRSCSLPLLAALLSSACTKFASELDTPEATSAPDALDPLQSADPSWSCLADPSAAEPAADPQQPLTYSMRVVNLLANSPLAGVRVRACFRADVDCANPVTPTFAGDGMVSVSVYEGFDGYLELTSPDMLPTLLFFPSAWSSELLRELEQLPVSLLPASALNGLAQSARVRLDPSGGLLSMASYDCQGPGAAGVRFEIDTAGVPFAFVNSLPVAFRDVTSEDGAVGFANVPPGIVEVTAFADDETQASVDTVLIRSGWVTNGRVLPRFGR